MMPTSRPIRFAYACPRVALRTKHRGRASAHSLFSTPHSRLSHGFTLLEVLAAMVLLALLMLGVYAGIRTATHTVHAGTAAVQRLDAMRAAQQFMRRELSQARALPWARDTHGNAVYFIGKPDSIRFVAPLPGYLGQLGPQLQTLELVRDGNSMRLQVTFARLPADGSTPQPMAEPQILLRGIRAGSFAYLGTAAGAWQTDWPRMNRLPALVQVKLQLANGSWPLLRVAPRVDSSVVMAPTANLPLLGAQP